MPKSEFWGHGDQLLKTVYSLYKHGQMVDVTLHCSGKEFKVHRVVLVAYSSHFYRRFFETPNGDDHISLDDVCSNDECLSLLIDFMYTGLLDVNTVTTDVAELINIAHALEIHKALEFLQDKVAPENQKTLKENREQSPVKVSNLPIKVEVDWEPDISEFDQEKEDEAADDHIYAGSDSDNEEDADDEKNVPTRRKGIQKRNDKPVKDEFDWEADESDLDHEKEAADDDAAGSDSNFGEDADDEKKVPTDKEGIQKNNRISCDICGKILMTTSMPSHKENVHDISTRKYTCSMCHETFRKRTQLQTHEAEVHSAYFCKRCKQIFSTMKELKEHKATHEKRGFKCKVCVKVYPSKAKLQMHEQTHSFEKISCEICALEFTTKQGFMKHMQVHVGAKSFGCPLCFESFFSESELKIHIANHSDDKSFMCQYCPKIFKQKTACISHEMIHTGEKPHKCEICSKGFRIKKSLQDHIRVHTGERPFVCEICSKAFRTTKILGNHKATHSTEKRYKCVRCEKCFASATYLRNHIRTHSDIRPHQCQYCPKTFATKERVRRHEKCHTGEKPFACNVCGQAFSDKPHLKRHALVHTGEKPYMCDHCGKGFTQRHNMTIHKCPAINLTKF